MTTKYVGQFQMGSVARVSDPCYEPGKAGVIEDTQPGTWHAFAIKESDDVVISKLVVMTPEAVSDCLKADYTLLLPQTKLIQTRNYIDSGQCGIYDNSKYKTYLKKNYERVCKLTQLDEETFYHYCKGLTKTDKDGNSLFTEDQYDPKFGIWESKEEWVDFFVLNEVEKNAMDAYDKHPFAGIIDDYGVVSSTAYGDQDYDVYISKNAEGKVTAIMVDYVG